MRPIPITPFTRTPQLLVINNPTSLLVPSQFDQSQLDIKVTYDSFLEANSQIVVLQRINMKIHCNHCWNELEGEGDPRCAYCLGRGYVSVFERHHARRMSSLAEHKMQLTEQSAPGPETIDEIFWFFESTVNPQEEDIIYEVSWQDAAQTILQYLIAAYWVTYADPMRAGSGVIAFWRASVKSRPIDRIIVSEHLRTLTPLILAQADGALHYSSIHGK